MMMMYAPRRTRTAIPTDPFLESDVLCLNHRDETGKTPVKDLLLHRQPFAQLPADAVHRIVNGFLITPETGRNI